MENPTEIDGKKITPTCENLGFLFEISCLNTCWLKELP
jgi:hypothetical protein